MKTIKQYMALCLVFIFIIAGGMMLMFDTTVIKSAWLSVGGAGVFFIIGIALGCYFSRKNLLPE
jgi:uncharacterized protein YneF (UPF0154 family)